MDQELKIRWIQALRSGKYRQAHSALCKVENKRYKYCCLGVLARVAGASFPKEDGVYDPTRRHPILNGVNIGKFGMLEQEFADKIGVTRIAQEQLARMNDEEGRNFREIADWVEQNL